MLKFEKYKLKNGLRGSELAKFCLYDSVLIPFHCWPMLYAMILICSAEKIVYERRLANKS